jgi:hypothetical protein
MDTAKKEPTQSTLIGTIFDKYPEVNYVSWHQYYDGPHFYVEPWSVMVNGKHVGSNNPFMPLLGDITTVGGKPVSEQEHAAIIELEDLMVLAAGGQNGTGTLDLTTETAVNLGALLRAILGDAVIVTINRDGSIKREQSDAAENAKTDAEFYAKRNAEHEAEDASGIAFKTHVLACGQCSAAIHKDEKRISRSYMCETGRGLAEVLGTASGFIDSPNFEMHLWDEVRVMVREDDSTDEERQQANDEVSAELDQMRRQYSAVDRGAKGKKKEKKEKKAGA